ncbi:MAG TPA: hypothetical protein VK714_20280, partial [Myxococcota bacterium]|nr:hypothetical protein [Myxococcota bacterium]
FRKGSELVPVSRSTRSGVPERIPRNGIHAGWTGSQSRFHTSEPHPMRDGEAQRFVDLGPFKAIGPHVDWRAVLYSDEA